MVHQAGSLAPWSASSDSLVGKANLRDAMRIDDSDGRIYIRQLPTSDGFRALMTDMKEIFHQEVKAIVDRVQLLEEAQEDIRGYTTLLHKHALVQAQAIRESCCHLEDLDNRERRKNLRVRGLLEVEGSEDVPLVLKSIFNELLGNMAP